MIINAVSDNNSMIFPEHSFSNMLPRWGKDRRGC